MPVAPPPASNRSEKTALLDDVAAQQSQNLSQKLPVVSQTQLGSQDAAVSTTQASDVGLDKAQLESAAKQGGHVSSAVAPTQAQLWPPQGLAGLVQQQPWQQGQLQFLGSQSGADGLGISQADAISDINKMLQLRQQLQSQQQQQQQRQSAATVGIDAAPQASRAEVVSTGAARACLHLEGRFYM